MVALDGPRIAPKSGQAKQLVVFLHGRGANGDDLIELGYQWQGLLPDAAFAAPDASLPCEGAPMGREWFPLTFRDPTELWRGVQEAAPALNAFLDAELARYGLDDTKLALVGFSQGTMMALHVGLRRATAPAGILGFSGLLVLQADKGPESLKEQVKTKPPILLTHGDRDEILPIEMFFFSKETLAAAEIPCQWHLSAGVGHGIDAGALHHGGLFLTQSFGLPYPQ
ncbi:alpha/beta hydrolase [Microvirga flavescens]|uniref:alpha/beta hydrolase n=1 Tax=Microvirga flavescens TaxID=2249811 RepID=UPI000DDC1D08|nr:dienelactone hydrolase family protein [Microvirga flavescens]